MFILFYQVFDFLQFVHGEPFGSRGSRRLGQSARASAQKKLADRPLRNHDAPLF